MLGKIRRQGGFGRLWREFRRDPKGVLAGALFHNRLTPTLIEFQRAALLQTVAPDELLESLLGRPPSIASTRAEFAILQSTLAERYRRPLPFRSVTQLSDSQSYMLYSLVRELRPHTVLETGVANGHSTVVLLHALEKNGDGTLWSVDISEQVGALVDPSEKGRWKLRLLPLRDERAAFAALLDEVGPIDLFEHDSDHSFEWQQFELRSVWQRLRPGAVLSVDDADWSWATIDFARQVNAPLRALVTPSRVCGVFRRP